MNGSKCVLVLAELRDGTFLPCSFELVSEGRRLADSLGCALTALAVGPLAEHAARELGGYGADEIVLADDPLLKDYTAEPYAKVVTDVIRARAPEAVLIAATRLGRDLAPRCAAILGTGLSADCVRIDADRDAYERYLAETSLLTAEEILRTRTLTAGGTAVDVSSAIRMTMPAYGGSLTATIVCPVSRPVMATVRPGAVERLPFDEVRAAKAAVTRFPVSLSPADVKTRVLETVRTQGDARTLADCEVVVAVGRGIAKDPERGIALAEELASALGGLVGGTRVAVEKGWIAPDRQIGQTGVTVRPKLLIALGISGAAQFTIGVPSADRVVAVNKDRNAPIFDFADYGIVGDVFRVVPELIRAFHAAP